MEIETVTHIFDESKCGADSFLNEWSLLEDIIKNDCPWKKNDKRKL